MRLKAIDRNHREKKSQCCKKSFGNFFMPHTRTCLTARDLMRFCIILFSFLQCVFFRYFNVAWCERKTNNLQSIKGLYERLHPSAIESKKESEKLIGIFAINLLLRGRNAMYCCLTVFIFLYARSWLYYRNSYGQGDEKLHIQKRLHARELLHTIVFVTKNQLQQSHFLTI